MISVNLLGRYYSDYAISFAKKRNKKIILTPHFTFHTNKHRFIKNFYSKSLFPSLLGKIDRLICFTNHESEFWQKKYPLVSDKIRIIPHYYGTGNQVKNRDGKADKNFLLYIGRAEKNKKTDLLIKSFSKVKDPKWEIYLTIGSEEITPDIQKIIEKDSRIKLLGYVSDEKKKELLKTVSALILPTSYEAFGIVTLEASSVKKPILCSDIPVLKEILDHRGVIYFSNNKDSIYNSILKFIKLDEKTYNEMGEINFKNLTKYDFSHIKSEYEKLFGELY